MNQLERVTIRSANADDIPRLIELERATSGSPHWSDLAYQAIAEEMNHCAGAYISVVAESSHDKALLGFLMAQAYGSDWEVENIVVAESERRHGFGSRLLQELIRIACQRSVANIFLEVRESNHPAIGLYTQNGFRQEGRRKDYYRNPDEDALLLRLVLNTQTK